MKRSELQRRTPLKSKTRLSRKTPLAKRSKTNSRRRKYGQEMRSSRFRALREKVFERDHWMCRLCGDESNLEAHHVHYRTLGREDGSELVTLCKHDHEREDAARLMGTAREWVLEAV